MKRGTKLEIITIEDNRYPDTLRKIKNPPRKLYAEGNVALLKSNIISMIGSRACSENGKKLAEQFAKELVYQGLTIASGMAIGIDTIAHQTTLQEGGKTIAVLGCGLGQLFPKENEELYQQIIQKSGLVITEYAPNVKACSQHFLARNRIVSGLSLGILVIEAAHRSGTSVTAKLAKEQGRKVFAVPHEIHDKHGIGTNRLIQNGAKIITTTEDMIAEFPFLQYKPLPTKLREKKTKRGKKVCKIQEYDRIYQWITEEPISLDEISKKSKEDVAKINNVLLMLEIEGYIEKVVGGYRCILEEK